MEISIDTGEQRGKHRPVDFLSTPALVQTSTNCLLLLLASKQGHVAGLSSVMTKRLVAMLGPVELVSNLKTAILTQDDVLAIRNASSTFQATLTVVIPYQTGQLQARLVVYTRLTYLRCSSCCLGACNPPSDISSCVYIGPAEKVAG